MSTLPEVPYEQFAAGLASQPGGTLPPRSVAALHAHYEELRRWAPRVALVGPAFAGELFDRHYGESLAGLELLSAEPGRLLDIGSGAGFPGFVLAAARPDLRVTLLEARERKWAFLLAAIRRAGLDCQAVNARVSADPSELPDEIQDLSTVTVRALRLEPAVWSALSRRMLKGARVLHWSGAEVDSLPDAFERGRELRLPGERRFVREFLWNPVSAP